MKSSWHAEARMQQRGISHEVVELIVRFGGRISDCGGAESIELEEKERKRLCKQFRQALKVLEKPGSPYVIVAEQDLLVTCAYPIRQRRRIRSRRTVLACSEAA